MAHAVTVSGRWRSWLARAGMVLAVAEPGIPFYPGTSLGGRTVSSNRRSGSLRIGAVAVVLALLAGHVAPACGGHSVGHGGWSCWSHGACAPCNYEIVETTVYVPRSFVENRTIKSIEYRHETREETIQVRRCVPEVKTYTREYTVMVPRERTKT